MTYTDRYNAIIHYFQRHPVDKKKIYCERHHIVPASCGGSDKKDNLVDLPAAWHYRVHCYLPFVMLEQDNNNGYSSMLSAWRRMLNSEKEKIDLLKINEESILYERLRKEFAINIGKLTSIAQAGSKNSQYGHHWWMNPETRESRSIKEGDPIPEGWIKGRKCNVSEIGHKKLSENGKRVNHATTTGYKWITNGITRKLLKPFESLPEGWKFCSII